MHVKIYLLIFSLLFSVTSAAQQRGNDSNKDKWRQCWYLLFGDIGNV